QEVLAGGVSSGLRRSMRPHPLYFTGGEGARVRDVDGNTYLDYGLAWGPLILGHCPPEVTKQVGEQLQRGLTYGAQHDLEFEVAEALTSIIPCADLVCFANSGTEIVQVALRLARAATGRPKYLKFEGHYHGWDDSVLVSYHPAAEQISASGDNPIPVGRGQRSAQEAIVAQWNDREQVERIFAEHSGEIAAVICEPLLCNTFCIPAEPGFLEFLRAITERHGCLLIFDEVITGFRLDLKGAQGVYGVVPDLATYAKAVGAGTALSVLAGRRQYMERIANGEVVHAGTLNGNPISLAAAAAALEVLSRNDGAVYGEMRRLSGKLRSGIEAALRAKGLPVVTSGEGPVFHVSFMEEPARNYRDTLRADQSAYTQLAIALLDEGVLVLQDGRWYVSAAHDDAAIDETLSALDRALS
ncbi:MAG TPA: aspartate aminotransferase family protein, partial [Bryobacteraceae bacterium]|nr:aspartate aminotransferase family protein [Bryobacteraceae bacterium]